MSDESLRQYVIRKLQSVKGNYPYVAGYCGVKAKTLARIARGETPGPRMDTIERIESYFRALDALDEQPKPKVDPATTSNDALP